jgi:predicted ATPase
VRRYIITGAPGAGKTTILGVLRDRGHVVVPEAATDVIARGQAGGSDEPWRDEDFLDRVALVQHDQRQEAAAAGVQIFDRSPICTLALARYSDRPVTPFLAGEVERVIAAELYQPSVFFVRLLGFVRPSAARRITYAESVMFERWHEQTYREYGFDLIDVPAGPAAQRADLIERHIRADVVPVEAGR